MKYLREILIGVLVVLLVVSTIGAVKGMAASAAAKAAHDSATTFAKRADSLGVLVETGEWHLALTKASAIAARKAQHEAESRLADALAREPEVVHVGDDTTGFVRKSAYDSLRIAADNFMAKTATDQIAHDRELSELRSVNIDLHNEVAALRNEVAQLHTENAALKKQIPGVFTKATRIGVALLAGVGIGAALAH